MLLKIIVGLVFFILLYLQLRQTLFLIAANFRRKPHKYASKVNLQAVRLEHKLDALTPGGISVQPGDYTLRTESGSEYHFPRTMVEDLFVLTPSADGTLKAMPKTVQARRKPGPEQDFYEVESASGAKYDFPSIMFEEIYDPLDASPRMRWVLKRASR